MVSQGKGDGALATALRPKAPARPSLGPTYFTEGVLNDCTSQGGVQLKVVTTEKLPGTQKTRTPESLPLGVWRG